MGKPTPHLLAFEIPRTDRGIRVMVFHVAARGVRVIGDLMRWAEAMNRVRPGWLWVATDDLQGFSVSADEFAEAYEDLVLYDLQIQFPDRMPTGLRPEEVERQFH